MHPTPDQTVTQALRQALTADGRWQPLALELLPDKGLAHVHVRLAGTGLLARVPKQSQVGLAAHENLAHQAACFTRAHPGGRTPRLAGVLPVSAALPRGALLVEEIRGRPPVLPQDLGALARTLGALHALPLPARADRPPLPAPADPLTLLADQIRQQALAMPQAGLAPSVRTWLEQELGALEALCRQPGRPAVRLIAFDAHPGNFIVRPDGSATLVDLEKCRYGPPGLDLAHATLYTSTTWDLDTCAVLRPQEVLAFHTAWECAVGPALADQARPWHAALRRAMWLWSLTWCCQWRVQSRQPPRAPSAGQDWSTAHSDAALVAHVRARVDDYLSADCIARMRDELHSLQQAWSA